MPRQAGSCASPEEQTHLMASTSSQPVEAAASEIEERPLRSTRIVLFCDIDGTLVHYPEVQEQWGQITGPSVLPGCHLYVDKELGRKHKILKLPASSTGLQGVISVKTLTELASLRAGGAALVMLTGARMSTLLQRLPFLPAADAYVCENGGRIFYHDTFLPTALPIAEDLAWRSKHNETAGPADQEGVPPAQRKGLLWDLYRSLTQDGWKVDTASYTTCIRFKSSPDKTDADLQTVLDNLPAGLASSRNLGAADVYPVSSGKEKVAMYLLEKFNASLETALFMCDDDNDLGLAARLPKVFLVGTTAESVKEAAEADPKKFVVATKGGILATEEILEHVEDYLGTFVLG
ncbi:hypothetical protein WJX72_009286 [[Myrmecia] bisecta]|uniref:Uncharacterized protein n=1 Tax=[Myrmecia] bisecta TaxID=41462 RepID=A0AAW1PTE8_9CHLO